MPDETYKVFRVSASGACDKGSRHSGCREFRYEGISARACFFLFSDYLQSRRILPLAQSTIAFHKEKHIMGFSNE